MATMLSSEVRSKLSKVLHQVFTENEDIEISHNGLVIGVLTTEAPTTGVKPMRVKVDEIRQAWTSHLELMTCFGARFVFRRRFKVGDDEAEEDTVESGKVYLLPKYRNPVLSRWKAHVEQGLGAKDETDMEALLAETKTDIQNELEDAQRICAVLATQLASVNARVEAAFEQLEDDSNFPDEELA